LLHSGFGQGNTLSVDLGGQLHDRMQPLPSHRFGPRQHGVDIDQLGTVPMLFQNAPAALDRVVFAVVGRIVQELDRLADVVGEFDHSLEKLRALAITFRTIIGFDLELGTLLVQFLGLAMPPVVEAIEDEVAGFSRTTEADVQLSTILVDYPKGDIFFLTAQIMVEGARIAPRLAPTRVVADVHGCFAVDADAYYGLTLGVAGLVFLLDIVEEGVGLRDFF